MRSGGIKPPVLRLGPFVRLTAATDGPLFFRELIQGPRIQIGRNHAVQNEAGHVFLGGSDLLHRAAIRPGRLLNTRDAIRIGNAAW